MRQRRLDLGHVILVAAATAGESVDDIVTGADVTLLALVVQRTRELGPTSVAAAEMLVGVAAGRPFPRSNHAVAWALAAHVADLRRHRLDLAGPDAAALVRAAGSGRCSEADVAAALEAGLRRRHSVDAAISRAFALPTRSLEPVVWACPRCRRPVLESPYRSSILVATPQPGDVVTDCARVHGAHGPAGIVRRYEPMRVFAAPELMPAGA